jgi:hypothetical protein
MFSSTESILIFPSEDACVFANNQKLTPFDTNWKKGSGATPLTIQDL